MDCAHLSDVVLPIFPMYGFHCTDIQTSKDCRAGVYPQLIPVLKGNLASA